MLQNHKKGNQQEPGVRLCGIQEAATTDEVQRARPHTLMVRVVSTRRAVPREWKDNPEAKMRSK